MPTFVSFLRGVNVGGKGMIAMAALEEMYEGLGFTDVRTLLQSGNVVFNAPRATPAALGKKIEAAVLKRFKAAIFVAVRTPDELQAIAAKNPFPAAARDDPSHLVVTFLSEAPTAAAATAFDATLAKFTAERGKLAGRELYLHYAAGIGTSKLTSALIERTLAVQGTARNWNTVTKLIALATALRS